ncbi:hypothetical protein [Pseudacidovorax sp. NFM-22]|uniref:hypothetical protein n=1 Tax=Pseudacidovorax sp. NFM-22 TaxID=2744469 RepID=UPI001F1F5685|nr:hypothetical protein [Pseudacidovorax sp. NFM-22]
MINGYPSQEELKNRMERQLSWRPGSLLVSAIWTGYLGALFEWGLIELKVYSELMKLVISEDAELDFVGYELFSDEPVTEEQKEDVLKNKIGLKGR